MASSRDLSAASWRDFLPDWIMAETGVSFGEITVTVLDLLVALGIVAGTLWAMRLTRLLHRKPDGLSISFAPASFILFWLLATGGILILLAACVGVTVAVKVVLRPW